MSLIDHLMVISHMIWVVTIVTQNPTTHSRIIVTNANLSYFIYHIFGQGQTSTPSGISQIPTNSTH